MTTDYVPETLTLAQVVKATGLTHGQVYGAIRSGRLPVQRPGPRCILVARLDLAAWLADPRARR
jgi:predicted DNA-binding transcriptional regulator AlpA